jgi:hypothetical protein
MGNACTILPMRTGAGFAFVGVIAACAAPRATEPAPNPSVPPSASTAPSAVDRAPVVDWPPVVMRCLQMGDSCGGSATTCRALVSLAEDARAEAMRCFDAGSCEAYTACFRAFSSRYLGGGGGGGGVVGAQVETPAPSMKNPTPGDTTVTVPSDGR